MDGIHRHDMEDEDSDVLELDFSAGNFPAAADSFFHDEAPARRDRDISMTIHGHTGASYR